MKGGGVDGSDDDDDSGSNVFLFYFLFLLQYMKDNLINAGMHQLTTSAIIRNPAATRNEGYI